MDDVLKQKILSLLAGHRVMTIATVRPDGWPHATVVGYGHEGITLWFFCSPGSQEARNLERDSRISITIDHDTQDMMSITGLSLAARAYRVSDRVETEKVIGMLLPSCSAAPPEMARMKRPAPEEVTVFRVIPEIISVLDYTQGFGHIELALC